MRYAKRFRIFVFTLHRQTTKKLFFEKHLGSCRSKELLRFISSINDMSHLVWDIISLFAPVALPFL